MMGASLDLGLSLVRGRTLAPWRVAQVGRAIDTLMASRRAGPALRSLQRTRLADTLRHAASHARADATIIVGGAHLDPEVIARRIPALGGRIVIAREELGDRLALRVEGDGLDAGAVHEALLRSSPRLRETMAGGLLRLEADVGGVVDPQRQVKAVSVADRRAARRTS